MANDLTILEALNKTVLATKSYVDGKLADKVDKEAGKGLSTNDLTATLKANYDAAYTHSQSAHAPIDAQKNSDITKAEIEAKLTGDITSHTHSQYLTEHQDLSEYAPIDSPNFINAVTVGTRKEGEAIGTNSLTVGDDVIANTTGVFAQGYQSTASGANSYAQGYKVTASSANSHAEGNNTTANNICSHAEGSNTIASGENAHAEGGGSEARGGASHAEGYNTFANGNCSHAEGYFTKASGSLQHVEGKYNIEDTTNTYAHIVGNGTADDARSNAHTLDWNGNAWYAGDIYAGGTSQDDAEAYKITQETEDETLNKMLEYGLVSDALMLEDGTYLADSDGKLLLF